MLLVNDNQFLLMVYNNQFKHYFTMTTAENGYQAVQIVKEHPKDHFDVIMLDINMPIMDGFEACTRIYSYLT